MPFLIEKMGAAAFDEDDERLLSGSAGLAPAAIQHDQPSGQARTPTVTAKPARTRRDLDDGIIQTLYGVNLELEGAAEDVAADPDAARARIETAIDRLAEVMRDVRRALMAPGAADPPAGMLDDTSLQACRAAGVRKREEHHA